MEAKAVLLRPPLPPAEPRQQPAGVRGKLNAALPAPTITRLSIDLGCAIFIFAIAAGSLANESAGTFSWSVPLGFTVVGVVFGFMMALLSTAVLQTIRWFAGRPVTRRPAGRRLARVALAAGVIAGIMTWALGPAAVLPDTAHAAVAALPAVFVLTLGVFTCLRVHRLLRASRHRWLRYAAHPLFAVVAALSLLVLVNRDLLAVEPAAGLLFPVAAWASIRIWRAMAKSERLAVTAAADIVLSLLAGTELVLLLVWVANVLDFPAAEVIAVRDTLGQTGSFADVPWWLWTGIYLLLAGASLAFALWPARLKAATRWFGRLRVISAADSTRRTLTVVHIMLLVIVLIGLSAPAAVTPVLRGKLRSAYAVTLQNELSATGELAAYRQILRQVGAQSPATALVAIVVRIHDTSPPPTGDDDATSTETDLAKRVGQTQGAALAVSLPATVPATESAEVRAAGFDSPVRGASDLDERLVKVGGAEKEADALQSQVNHFAELAAVAVSNVLQVPHLGGNEIVQIVREYLSGLVEGSPIKEFFAAWAKRHVAFPPADRVVFPDPGRLEAAATAALTMDKAQFADSSAIETAINRMRGESPVIAAVDLVNQARYLQENSGPCAGCAKPEQRGEQQGGTDDPGESHDDVFP